MLHFPLFSYKTLFSSLFNDAFWTKENIVVSKMNKFINDHFCMWHLTVIIPVTVNKDLGTSQKDGVKF